MICAQNYLNINGLNQMFKCITTKTASTGFRLVVAIQKDNGNTKNWLLTAIDLTQKPK